MMPIKGLSPKDVVLPKKILPAKGGIYFSAIALSMWDNIHGPKILQVWQGPSSGKDIKSSAEASPNPDVKDVDLDSSSDVLESTLRDTSELTDATILSVANYTLNDEAGRADDIVGIESKFYSLSKYQLIAHASIFTIELVKGRTEVFSFLLLLPIEESSEFLARFMFCELSVRKLLQDLFLSPLNKECQKDRRDYPRGSIKTKVEEVLKEFDKPLLKFTQAMVSLKQSPLPESISLPDTHLGMDSTRPEIRAFLTQVINSHIQTSGYTIVLGSDWVAVNKMILTLGLFLSPKERKMSRLVCDSGKAEYEPHLFLQGMVWSPKKRDYPGLPFTKGDLHLNKLPQTIIFLDDKQVLQVESKINYFIGRKEVDSSSDHLEAKAPTKSAADTPCQLKDFEDVERNSGSQLVKEFLLSLFSLSTTGGLRETFIAQFLRFLKLKALALAKYLDSEIKPVSNLEYAAEMFALKSANAARVEKRRVNTGSLQQDLTIESRSDLLVIMAFTEKIRPRTYFDILGDPQDDSMDVIKEFASL